MTLPEGDGRTVNYRVTNHAKERCLERWGFEMTERDGARIFEQIHNGGAVRTASDDRGKGEAWEVTCRAYVMVVIIVDECVLTVKPRREWNRPREGTGTGNAHRRMKKKDRRKQGLSKR